MELYGKTACFLGDSITEGHSVKNKRYDNILQEKYHLTAYNYGIGGTRIAHQTIPSAKARHDLCFCGRAYDMEKNADLVVVYGGVNDYLHGDAPLGSMGDETPATFYGGLHFLMTFLQETYPQAQIVFMTPAHCKRGNGDMYPSADPQKGLDPQPLSAYVAAVLAMGEKMGIPVLNLYENLGIDPNREEDYIRYTADGLHFNDDGHMILANCLEQFLLAL